MQLLFKSSDGDQVVNWDKIFWLQDLEKVSHDSIIGLVHYALKARIRPLNPNGHIICITFFIFTGAAQRTLDKEWLLTPPLPFSQGNFYKSKFAKIFWPYVNTAANMPQVYCCLKLSGTTYFSRTSIPWPCFTQTSVSWP